MSATMQALCTPEHIYTEKNKLRRVGIELEMAGLQSQQLVSIIQSVFGGTLKQRSPLDMDVTETSVGKFKVELDASYMKALAEQHLTEDAPGSLQRSAIEIITKASELVVPWEVVSPPINITELEKVNELIEAMRDAGALGTRHALHFAFGLHINPELPDLKASTIVAYMKAYMCLYDWIVSKEKIDFTRIVSSYIKHFGKDYIRKVIDLDYKPSLEQLIDDYLSYNPSRNRSLDMLPLFHHLDSERVDRVISDQRIQSRPTLHYRLPNCDIDNTHWNLSLPWNLWITVEKLVYAPDKLHFLCERYSEELTRPVHAFENRWPEFLDSYLIEHNFYSSEV